MGTSAWNSPILVCSIITSDGNGSAIKLPGFLVGTLAAFLHDSCALN